MLRGGQHMSKKAECDFKGIAPVVVAEYEKLPKSQSTKKSRAFRRAGR